MPRNRRDHSPSPFGGPVNKPFHLLTPMEFALFEAYIEQRPYCFLGSYLRCLQALTKESLP